ncbi:MAG: hypothetical protein LBQ22_00020 [Bacteroidales bacterium]|jgi:hypothetical protein|nr:hypothetical protein [Bacteroidales bacterium]
MKQYITYKEHIFENIPVDIKTFCINNGLEGTEVFFDDIVPRTNKLFSDNNEKTDIINKLTELQVKRLHCSYWAYPTSFLTKSHFNELIERFGSIDKVKEYYCDLTGKHIWDRWQQEYEIATAMNVQAYTFHLIDYAPIDGEWEFTIPISEIKQAMIYMIQQFILNLIEDDLLTEKSPIIEIENAGWGLEYGTQTNCDFIDIYRQLYDPLNKVKIGWDINHILHATGKRTDNGIAYFMLPDEEKTNEMVDLEKEYVQKHHKFAYEWITLNILDPQIIDKISAIHLSDCKLKDIEYFIKGKLQPPYSDEIDKLPTWEEKEEYGVNIVLTHYDSHVPLQKGILLGTDIKFLLNEILKANQDYVILHELKNSNEIQIDLTWQKSLID